MRFCMNSTILYGVKMKVGQILFLFFFFAVLLIYMTIQQNAEDIYGEYLEKERVNNLQSSYAKTYYRQRTDYIPLRSFSLVQKEIDNILIKTPIIFENNSSVTLENSILVKIVKIINRVKEDVVLSINTHSNTKGSAIDNLNLSQKRADNLKAYFLKRTNLPFIVAIGYGDKLSLKKRAVEVNLKRIKE
ncbi:MAG: Unknown protein [uncultured Sulfurovum sp.]|uniref:Uncharacterized protein n=1 Tax=uncultured Sulfurovum sp. TaxID=269237 RepID=A0A6S6SDQ5_9BACT|nr:MAG: Unknown protein [uncultured Sulfurovum sp.]